MADLGDFLQGLLNSGPGKVLAGKAVVIFVLLILLVLAQLGFDVRDSLPTAN